ncbi:MAG TPA: ABC transporter permease [Clostridia bacterium]|nr:ABC transporter permease [Clostridia bacterium]
MLSTILSFAFLTDWMIATVRMATPLLLAALGGIISERAGIVNIALEGMMLMGALFGTVGAHYSGNPWVGALVGTLAGGATALILAYMSINLRSNQVVVAAALNLFCLGVTSFFFRVIFKVTTDPKLVPGFGINPVPVLSDIPVIGHILFSHTAIVYAAFLLVPVVSFALFKTTFGLKLRAVGEHPMAADTVGVNVYKVRYIATVVGGLFAGLGGVYLSLGQLNMFMDNMVAGRGFIALAAIIFGGWKPFGALGATLLFGAADALQMRFQALGFQVPYQFMLMLPYILTMAALAGVITKATPPAAEGIPYVKEEG